MFPIRDHNPSERVAYVTYALIAANVVIWVWSVTALNQQADLGRLYYDYAMIPARVSAGENWASLVTATFLHANLMHLAGNMLFLFIFGDNMEDEMGPLPFLGFYLAAGVLANVAQWAAAPGSPVPVIGASGAVAGVMGGYLLLFPKARVDIFIFLVVIIRILPVPAWVMLGLWFLFQLWGGFGTPADGGGVAYWAHAGGFVIGLLLTVPVWLRRGAAAYWSRTHGHPPHPDARYPFRQTSIPRVPRR